MTNATKALLIAFLNADLALALAFGIPLSTNQIGACGAAINAGLSLWVGITRNSPQRKPKQRSVPPSPLA
jgi:hypothetical protein